MYVALYIHLPQIHTQLPYQLHRKLSIRPWGFSSSRQHCIGALHSKDGAVPAMQGAEQSSSSFLGNESPKFSQVYKSTANSFLQGSVLFRHSPAQSWNISWGISLHSPAFDLPLARALAVTQGRDKLSGKGLHHFQSIDAVFCRYHANITVPAARPFWPCYNSLEMQPSGVKHVGVFF